uniref:EB domain-containing protein n=1 Tax=Romanomermis culicivorax TaxID=13658 RepID=A0A915JP82_ROMCU
MIMFKLILLSLCIEFVVAQDCPDGQVYIEEIQSCVQKVGPGDVCLYNEQCPAGFVCKATLPTSRSCQEESRRFRNRIPAIKKIISVN